MKAVGKYEIHHSLPLLIKGVALYSYCDLLHHCRLCYSWIFRASCCELLNCSLLIRIGYGSLRISTWFIAYGTTEICLQVFASAVSHAYRRRAECHGLACATHCCSWQAFLHFLLNQHLFPDWIEVIEWGICLEICSQFTVEYSCLSISSY